MIDETIKVTGSSVAHPELHLCCLAVVSCWLRAAQSAVKWADVFLAAVKWAAPKFEVRAYTRSYGTAGQNTSENPVCGILFIICNARQIIFSISYKNSSP